MYRRRFILLFLIFICFISGCTIKMEPPYDFMTDKLAKVPIQDLPYRWYGPDEGRDSGYYVYKPQLGGAEIYNEDIMIDFINKVESGQEAYIRTVYYTLSSCVKDEPDADPVFTDFYYNGKYYYVTIDNTRDLAAEDAKIAEYRYNNLIKLDESESGHIHYFITDLKEVTAEMWADNEEYEIILLVSIKNEA